VSSEAVLSETPQRRIPLWVKILYTAFIGVLVPCYWYMYGPTNFLYFCDVALFMTLAAVWLESPLLASMPAVGILAPQTLWIVDFLGSLVGLPVTGMTAYMFEFDDARTMFIRGLSFFHFWLPLFLLWIVYRLGYDRRALPYWTVLAWILMTVCYVWMPPPPAPKDNEDLPVNINYVFGLNEEAPQDRMPPHQYFALVMVALPLVLFLPTHWMLRTVFRPVGGERCKGHS